jgi:hypothetical protein
MPAADHKFVPEGFEVVQSAGLGGWMTIGKETKAAYRDDFGVPGSALRLAPDEGSWT